jgi:hypothetical protein
MNSFFTLHSFLEVGKTQDLPTKFWQTLGDALTFIVKRVEAIVATSKIIEAYAGGSDLRFPVQMFVS